MADIDLNLYLHSEKFTTALKEAGVNVDKFYSDWKLSQEEQIVAQQRLIASTEALRKKNAEIQAQITAGKGSYGALFKEMGKNKDQILQNEIALDQMAKAEKTVGTETAKTTEEVKKSEKTAKSYTEKMRTVRTVIALVVAAFGVFKLIMEATNQTANQLQVVLRTVGAVTKELLRSVADKNFKNLGERLGEAAKRGKEFAQSMQLLQAQQLKSNAVIDKLNLKIAEYRNELESTTLTETDRQTKLDKIFDLEKQVAYQRAALAQETLDVQLKNSKLSKQYTQEELDNILMLAPAYELNKKALDEYIKAQDRVNGNTQDFSMSLKDANDILEKAPANIISMADSYRDWAIDGGKSMTDMAKANTDYTNAQVAQLAVTKEVVDKEKKGNDDRLKNQEEFNKAIEKLYDDYNNSKIDSLTGVEQINAIRDFNINEINEKQAQLEKLGTLTEEEYKIFDVLRENENKKAEKDTADFNIKELEELKKANEEKKQVEGEYIQFWEEAYKKGGEERLAAMDFQHELELQALELSGKDTEKAVLELQKKYFQLQKDFYNTPGVNYDPQMVLWIEGQIEAVDKKIKASGFNFWEAIGITDKKQQDLIKEDAQIIIDNALNALDTIYANKVDDAERNRQLIDDQIGYTQDALNQEIELAKLGYANNVTAKRKELEELKKASEKAVKEEEEAKKKQRAFDLVKLAADSLAGIAKIIINTMVANAIALTSPLTAPIHIALNNAMMGLAIASIIASVAAASSTKLAKGGVGTDVGIIEGKSHQQGGERFLDHVEIEKGEMWGVLSRSAAAKHGKEFSQVVTSFNKDNLVIERQDAPNNYINVDVNQTNSRLDKVENQLIKLNRHFAGQKEVHETADMRIEKIGNKTRIIRK